MTREDLAAIMSVKNNESMKACGVQIQNVFDAIADALHRGEKVTLRGFGSFTPVQRAAHAGRNPRNGDPIAVSASKTVRFKPGKELKASL